MGIFRCGHLITVGNFPVGNLRVGNFLVGIFHTIVESTLQSVNIIGLVTSHSFENYDWLLNAYCVNFERCDWLKRCE